MHYYKNEIERKREREKAGENELNQLTEGNCQGCDAMLPLPNAVIFLPVKRSHSTTSM